MHTSMIQIIFQYLGVIIDKWRQEIDCGLMFISAFSVCTIELGVYLIVTKINILLRRARCLAKKNKSSVTYKFGKQNIKLLQNCIQIVGIFSKRPIMSNKHSIRCAYMLN